MEDRVIVADLTAHAHFTGTQRAVLLGVFDGHAGHEAAEHLAAEFQAHLLASPLLAGREYGGALRQVLLECERQFMDAHFTSGSTALVALMVDSMLHIANVGDCRAVVSDEAEARALTWDHKPTSNELEKARLQVGLTAWAKQSKAALPLYTLGAYRYRY
jgi:protein phosphatase 1L